MTSTAECQLGANRQEAQLSAHSKGEERVLPAEGSQSSSELDIYLTEQDGCNWAGIAVLGEARAIRVSKQERTQVAPESSVSKTHFDNLSGS